MSEYSSAPVFGPRGDLRSYDARHSSGLETRVPTGNTRGP